MENTGNFFKQARESVGLTQRKLANAMGYDTAQFVSNWERGLCLPNANKIKDLSRILKLKPETLVGIFVDNYAKSLAKQLGKK